MPRLKCPNCQYIQERCVCNHLTKIHSPIPILIIQFPKENKHPFNTVNLLKLNLTNLVIVEDELVDHNLVVKNFLNNSINPALIFKTQNSQLLENISLKNKLAIDALIFIDGTWDKAKRIYLQSKILKELPALSFNREKISEYKIRKGQFAEGLSTIESVSYVLENIFQNEKFQKILEPFNYMVETQMKLREKKSGE